MLAKVFVTGGSGFIGRAVMGELRARGIAAVNYDIANPDGDCSTWIRGDLLDSTLLARSMAEAAPDAVIHLAAKASITSTAWNDFASIHEGTRNVLNAIEATLTVHRLANVSTQLVIGPDHEPRSLLDFRPYTVYGEAKAHAEMLLLQWRGAADWFTFRPANIWGPHHPSFANAIWKYIESGHYLHPRGKPVFRSYGYVANTANQIIDLLLADPDITSRQVYYGADAVLDSATWADAFAIAFTGKRARRVPVPILRAMGLGGDLLGPTGIRVPIDSGRVMRMTESYPVPVEPTIAITGVPKVSLEEGVGRTVAWLKGSFREGDTAR